MDVDVAEFVVVHVLDLMLDDVDMMMDDAHKGGLRCQN